MKRSLILARCLILSLVFPVTQPGMLEARVTPSHGFNMFSAQEELQAGQIGRLMSGPIESGGS